MLGQNTTCSGSVIGCLPEDGGTKSVYLTAGSQYLSFEPDQVGTRQDTWSNPFGLLYELDVHSDSVIVHGLPNGGMTLILFFGALGGLETLRRRFRL